MAVEFMLSWVILFPFFFLIGMPESIYSNNTRNVNYILLFLGHRIYLASRTSLLTVGSFLLLK